MLPFHTLFSIEALRLGLRRGRRGKIFVNWTKVEALESNFEKGADRDISGSTMAVETITVKTLRVKLKLFRLVLFFPNSIQHFISTILVCNIQLKVLKLYSLHILNISFQYSAENAKTVLIVYPKH